MSFQLWSSNLTNCNLCQVDWENYRKNKKANISKQSQQQQPSPIIPKANTKISQDANNRTESPREDFAYVNNFLQDPKNRQPSSPSVRTIMTTATKVPILEWRDDNLFLKL